MRLSRQFKPVYLFIYFTKRFRAQKHSQADISSIVKGGYQNNFKPFYFFLRKDFARTKTLTSKHL